MLCLRRFYLSTLRRYHWQSWSSDSLLSQLNNCASEDQVFDLVGRNKTKLSEKHVGMAITLLWTFQKKKPENLRSLDYIKSHSQFLTLRILAENKIESMDDDALVNILYDVLRLKVDACDSLIQELVMEGWRRIDRLNISLLSKFALCLYDQDIRHSPLMGHIADIVNKNLDSLQNIRALSVLMVSISAVISQNFRNRLIQKIEFLLETTESISLNCARRLVHFLRNVNLPHYPLLDKCNKAFLQNMDQLDINDIALILGFYRFLHFNNNEFRLAAKQKLMELMDDCSDPFYFSRLFATLAPMAGPLVKEQLIETSILMANEFDHRQTFLVLETMQEIECRNSYLLQKIVSLLHKHLDKYKPVTLLKVMQFLATQHFSNYDFYFKLQTLLINYLETSVIPSNISTLVRIMCMIPNSYMDETVVSRIDAVLPQCNLSNLCIFAMAVMKWAQRDRLNRQNSSMLYGKLLEKINNAAFYRLQKISSLDLLLEDLKYVSKEWFEEVILEETMVVLQRMLDQITWENMLELSSILIRTSYLCPPLLDRIATVTVQHADKIYGPETYSLLHPFTVLNYDPPQGVKFFRTCIEKLSSHLDYFEPHHLVQLGFSLAVAEYFPENLIKAIFNIEFLGELDAELETLPNYLNKLVRLRLMNLNRAVCLECPELQIPWFHDSFCQQLQEKSNNPNALQQQIQGFLGEILGGNNFVKVSVLCPYYYRIDFEFILDKNKKPLPYRDQSMHWGQDDHLLDRRELPTGAKRIAVEFLDSKDFCKNLNHMKGETAIKKRHLEILGYHVVQIPHFEWNSMELSSNSARKEYLKKKILEMV